MCRDEIIAWFAERPIGAVASTADFSTFGTRSTVQRALAELVRSENVIRLSRGLYVMMLSSEYGGFPPSAEEVVKFYALLKGIRVGVTGATAANWLGLSTQVPVESVFLTDGKSKTLRFGRRKLFLRKTQAWMLDIPDSREGLLLKSMAHGGGGMAESYARLGRQKFTQEEWQKVARIAGGLPAWLKQTLAKAELEPDQV